MKPSRKMGVGLLALLLTLGTPMLSSPLMAADKTPPPKKPAATQVDADEKGADPEKPMVYGWQLMTPAERAEFRGKMRAATPAERQKMRAEHHEQMKKRAAEKGVTLPDEPGQGPGPGMGRGPGMGPGRGMGPGMGGGY